jgi:Uma2 family endonuclease
MSAQVEPLLTNKDLECLPDDGKRYELIEGELYVSDPSDLIHQRTLGKVFHALSRYLNDEPIGEAIIGPGVIFSDYDGVIPDLVYLSNERSAEVAGGARILGAPNLVIEIVSPGMSNAERDRKFKLKLYRKYGVEEYWIVDPAERAIEAYRTEGSLKLFTTFLSDEVVNTPLLPGFTCAAKHFFEKPLPLRDSSCDLVIGLL